MDDNIHSAERLTKRELQILDKLMEGLPNKVIAAQLFISERTVKFHCANIYQKLNVDNRYSLLSLVNLAAGESEGQ